MYCCKCIVSGGDGEEKGVAPARWGWWSFCWVRASRGSIIFSTVVVVVFFLKSRVLLQTGWLVIGLRVQYV